MERVRWLSAQWPISMRTIGNNMKTMEFLEDSIDGFIVERIREDFIEGRFIEKVTYQEVISDPFGNEEHFDRTDYHTTTFTLFSRFPQIELLNGQRSYKGFINSLLVICGFKLVVSPLTVNLLDWVTGLQKVSNQKVVVDSVQITGIELGQGVIGAMLLKGDKDIREVIERIVGGRRYALDKVQVKLFSEERITRVHLSSNGCAKLPFDHIPYLLPILRKTMPSTLKVAVIK